jgi:hypothetical protein
MHPIFGMHAVVWFCGHVDLHQLHAFANGQLARLAGTYYSLPIWFRGHA